MEDGDSTQSMDEEAPFISSSPNEKPQRTSLRLRSCALFHSPTLPWTILLLLTLYTIITSLLTSSSHQRKLWTPSDFGNLLLHAYLVDKLTKTVSARDAISQTTVTFSSSLDFVDKEHIYRIFDPNQPKYVGGNASEMEEIDGNWDALILPADIYVNDEEAKIFGGDLYRSPEMGKFKIELEVFHSLHCLNMLRKRIHSDIYLEMLSHNADIHIDHCIESLRELIMCEGNMTPIPLEWSEKGERLNPNYASKHTCRDFVKLKEWMMERSKKGV